MARPRTKKPFKVVTAANFSVPIYQTSKGFTAKWTFAGKPQRMDRVSAEVIEDEIKRVAAALANGLPTESSLALKKHLEYYQQIEQTLGGIPLHVALDSFLRGMEPNKLQPAKVSELYRRFIAAKRASGRVSETVRGYEGSLRYFMPEFGGKEIHTILSPQISQWLGARPGNLRTRKNIHGALKTFFRWARDEAKALPAEKRTEPELLAIIKVKRVKAQIYTPEEMKKILRHLTGEILDVVVLTAFCGCRSSEAHGEETDHPSLNVEEILFAHNVVRIGEQKVQSKGDRFCPLSPNAKLWLAHLKGKKGPIWTGKRFQQKLARAVREAGVPFRRNGFRKSWITYRMAIVKNANQVAEEGGNSADEIYKSYRRPELESVAKKYFGLKPELTSPPRFIS